MRKHVRETLKAVKKELRGSGITCAEQRTGNGKPLTLVLENASTGCRREISILMNPRDPKDAKTNVMRNLHSVMSDLKGFQPGHQFKN